MSSDHIIFCIIQVILFNINDFFLNFVTRYTGASKVALMVKNPLANAGDPRDMGLTPG